MDVAKNAVKLLKKQIEKLSQEDFDLEGWKGGTYAVLQRLFGPDSPKLEQLKQIKIDYSSWALRDSTANYNPRDTVKHVGRDLLKTCIEEIELLGVPNQEHPDNSLKALLEKNLSSSDLKKIQAVIDGKDSVSRKQSKLRTIIKKWDDETKSELLAQLIAEM